MNNLTYQALSQENDNIFLSFENGTSLIHSILEAFMVENYKDCLFNNKNAYRPQQRFKSYNHDVYTEEVNKIAISANDDKRLQTHDKITTYPYGTNAFKVCESKMLNNRRFIL